MVDGNEKVITAFSYHLDHGLFVFVLPDGKRFEVPSEGVLDVHESD
jgi:hypothetical protein